MKSHLRRCHCVLAFFFILYPDSCKPQRSPKASLVARASNHSQPKPANTSRADKQEDRKSGKPTKHPTAIVDEKPSPMKKKVRLALNPNLQRGNNSK